MPSSASSNSLACLALPLAATVATLFSPIICLAQRADQATTQPTPRSVAPTLKVSTQLVVVDVVVTDKNHKSVHGLQLSDFTLTEDSKQQAISHFEDHTIAGVTKVMATPKLPAGIFTNDAPAVTGRPVNVLLLDAVNTPMDGQALVREQLIKYLKKIPPGTPIAIYGLGRQLTMLQGVTADPNVVSDPATLARIHNFSAPGRSTANRISGPEALAEAFFASANPSPSTIPPPRPCIGSCPEPIQSLIPGFMGRYGDTLDALSELARSLAGIPGRKNLIWFSGSFPESLFHYTGGNEDVYRESMDRLTRSQVAIYSIYTRGVGGTFVCGADLAPPQPRLVDGKVVIGNSDAGCKEGAALNILQGEHDSMSAISEATGGRAFLETNDFAGAMASAIDEGSSYYTLSYTPSNIAHDGEFRKIKVQLDRHGLTLAYRPGYYLDPPEKQLQPIEVASTTGIAPSSADSSRANLIRVMTLGTPTPTEMLLHVGVIPITPAGEFEDKPAPGNVPARDTHGPYRRYNVNYYVGRSEIGFLPGESGKVRADLEFVIFVFEPDGTLVNATSNTMHLHGTQEEINQAVARGLFYHQEISVPAKGEYFLRIAVHDLNGDRFGAVEVATSAVKNVVPRTAPLTTPATSSPSLN